MVRTSIGCFLDSMALTTCSLKERVIWQTVKQASLFHHLLDARLDRWNLHILRRLSRWEWVEVQTENSHAIGELLHILPRSIQCVEVVQRRQSTEEAGRATHAVTNNETLLARSFNIEDFDDGPCAGFDTPHHILIDLKGVLACLLEENRVGHFSDVRLAVRKLRRLRRRQCFRGEVAFRDEITTELLLSC